MLSHTVRTADDSSSNNILRSVQKLAKVKPVPPPNPNKPLTSFLINDILGSDSAPLPSHESHSIAALIDAAAHRRSSFQHLLSQHRQNKDFSVPTKSPNKRDAKDDSSSPSPEAASPSDFRPMDDDIFGQIRLLHSSEPGEGLTATSSWAGDETDSEDEIDVENVGEDDEEARAAPHSAHCAPMGKRKKAARAGNGVSPLDALLEMTSKAFDGRQDQKNSGAEGRDHLHLFSKSQPPKKRRKSRTAFTNQQIYELEKRFLYQKYLSPADRDQIAHSLGLTNAQVITWFQNRRAKMKRDLEELKADVKAAKMHSAQSLEFLKKFNMVETSESQGSGNDSNNCGSGSEAESSVPSASSSAANLRRPPVTRPVNSKTMSSGVPRPVAGHPLSFFPSPGAIILNHGAAIKGGVILPSSHFSHQKSPLQIDVAPSPVAANLSPVSYQSPSNSPPSDHPLNLRKSSSSSSPSPDSQI